MDTNIPHHLNWKLRRIAAGIRQQDLALRAGISTTRYSAIERGERMPSKLEAELIDKLLPQLPTGVLGQRKPGEGQEGEFHALHGDSGSTDDYTTRRWK